MNNDLSPSQISSNPEQQSLIQSLLDANQAHLFENWDESGTHEEAQKDFLSSLEKIDRSYPGGLGG